MFLRNYYKYYSRDHAGLNVSNVHGLYINTGGTVGPALYSSSTTVSHQYAPSYRKTAMNYVRTYDIKTSVQNSSTSNLNGGYGVVFGSGSTPPTIDDYTLSGDVITGITVSYTTENSVSDDYTSATYSKTYTITNNNSEAITIGEIALVGEECWQSQYSSNTRYYHGFILYERTVLEEPIVIPAGGVGQVTYTIRKDWTV